MKRIDIVFFDATSGHRTAAYAIQKALAIHDPTVITKVINLPDVLIHQPLLKGIAQLGVDIFNWGVKREKAWFLRQQIGLFQTIQSHIPDFMIKQVSKFWQVDPPDLVVSVLPISNWLLERAFHMVCPDRPYLIIPVDFEENKKNYWFDPRMDAYYLNPTQMLTQQCAALGIESTRFAQVNGMPIDPAFYENPSFDKSQALRDLGLNPDLPTVLVGFGGQGSIMVQRCADQLADSNLLVNVIFLCGRHKPLYDSLSAFATPYPKVVLGYTPQPPAYYYHLADIIIGKPGSMTITEAIITYTGLLAIESESLALVQRGNEAWLRQSKVGEVIRVPDLPSAIQRVLTSTTIQDAIRREWHRGVFEIASMIHNLAHGRGLSI